MAIVMPEGVLNNPSLDYVREFVERRAWINAVVSLPDGTFRSAKASVKASLLFLTKFTGKDVARVQTAREVANKEAEHRLDAEAIAKSALLRHAWEDAKGRGEKMAATLAKKELDGFVKRTKAGKRTLAERLFRAAIDYPVFMYDAQWVGITPTGSPEDNELYPNGRVPPGIEKTALELYEEFLRDPESFCPET